MSIPLSSQPPMRHRAEAVVGKEAKEEAKQAAAKVSTTKKHAKAAQAWKKTVATTTTQQATTTTRRAKVNIGQKYVKTATKADLKGQKNVLQKQPKAQVPVTQTVAEAEQMESFPFDMLQKYQISDEHALKLQDYYNRNKDTFKSQSKNIHTELDMQGIPYSVVQIPKGPRAGIYVITKIEVGSGTYNVGKIAIRLDTGKESVWRTALSDDVKPGERNANKMVSDDPNHFLSGEEVEFEHSYRERRFRYHLDKDEPDLIKRTQQAKAHISKYERVKKLGIMMDYAEGGPLTVKLRNNFSMEKNPAHMKEGCKMMLEYAETIAALHKKRQVHLDQKPENTFIVGDGSIRLGDFGSTQEEGEDILNPNSIGTPGFVAPEILDAANNYYSYEANQQADIWSMGCCFLDMMGERASGVNWYSLFEDAEDNNTINDSRMLERIKDKVLPGRNDPNHAQHELHSIIDQCLQLNPKNRPSADQVVLMLKNLNSKLT